MLGNAFLHLSLLQYTGDNLGCTKFRLQPHASAISFARTVRLFLGHVLQTSLESRARSLGFDASDPKFNHWVKNTAEYYVDACSLYSDTLIW